MFTPTPGHEQRAEGEIVGAGRRSRRGRPRRGRQPLGHSAPMRTSTAPWSATSKSPIHDNDLPGIVLITQVDPTRSRRRCMADDHDRAFSRATPAGTRSTIYYTVEAGHRRRPPARLSFGINPSDSRVSLSSLDSRFHTSTTADRQDGPGVYTITFTPDQLEQPVWSRRARSMTTNRQDSHNTPNHPSRQDGRGDDGVPDHMAAAGPLSDKRIDVRPTTTRTPGVVVAGKRRRDARRRSATRRTTPRPGRHLHGPPHQASRPPM